MKKLSTISKRNKFVGGVISAVLVVGLLFVGRDAIVNKLNDLKLLPQSENFTELYLLNHQTIPYTINPNKEVSFEFAIHNLENKDLNYPYVVFLDIDGKKQPLVKNSVFVKNNQTKIIKQSLSANYYSKRFEIGVSLVNKNQAVDFWVQE